MIVVLKHDNDAKNSLPRSIRSVGFKWCFYNTGDYYIKDFKYISPDALAPKNVKVAEEKTLLEKWFLEVVKGLKQFFYQGSLHGVK